MNDDTPKCAYEGCSRDLSIYREYCIFHMPKKTAEKKKKLTSIQKTNWKRIETTFRVEFYKLLEEIHNDPSKDKFDLSGFQFPDIDLSKKELKEKTGLDGFSKPVSFSDATFCGEAAFSGTKFSCNADFSYTKFSGEARFPGTLFSDKTTVANFFRATFSEKATFTVAKFFSEANFTDATFSGETGFVGAKFYDVADFFGAIFSGKADTAIFGGAKFFGKADFRYTTFSAKANFSWATFSAVVDFRLATFEKEAIFQGDEDSDKRCFYGNCDFTLLKVSKGARVEFQKVNLSKASFLDTDLEQLTFRDVEWHDPRKKNTLLGKIIHPFVQLVRPNRKIALWDEFKDLEEDEEERNYDKIAENYRQLTLNYERKRNFEMVERFIACEMEIRRKRLVAGKMRFLEKRRELIGYNIYRSLSNYGTSYWRALAVLLLLFLAFSGVFMYTGVSRVNMEKSGYETAVNYDLFPLSDLHPVGWKQFGKDIKETMSYSLSILPFQRVQQYQPFGVLTSTVKAISVLLIYAQTALLLLAIRRRFRHK